MGCFRPGFGLLQANPETNALAQSTPDESGKSGSGHAA